MSTDIHALLSEGLKNHDANRFVEAEKLYRQVLRIDAQNADALHLLGLMAHELGNHAAAVPLIEKAIVQRNDIPQFHNNLGNALKELNRLDDSISHYKKALKLMPDYADAINNLGNAYNELGEFETALVHFMKALTINPRSPEYLNNLGSAYLGQGKEGLAIDCFRRALALRSDYAEVHFNLGKIHMNHSQFSEAIAYYLRTTQLKPSFVDAYIDMSYCLQQQFMLDAAVACCEQAIALKPEYAKAWNNLGGIFLAKGELDNAISCFKRAGNYSNVMFAMVFDPSIKPKDITDAATEFGKRTNSLRKPRSFVQNKNPNRKLRIGYISPDFRSHPVNYFFEPFLNLHDKKHFELFAYSNVIKEDTTTTRLKKEFDHWRDIKKISDDAAADLIERDKIDILVDLAGHTGDNRLLVFARKPAPIQVTWLGFPATTGMKAMDYRITDIYAEPEGMTEHLNVEKLWRLPTVFACYQAPDRDIPVIDHPPFEDNGHITFGCFNNFAKVTDPVLETWARIMAQVPDSRLLLEITGLDSPKFRAETEQRLKRLGLPMERVTLEPRRRENQFVLYNKLDIALDPFPCNGGTTSFDCMWMGVPFVALAGEHFVSRMGVTILTNAGLPELIAKDKDQYVKIAAELAQDKDRLRKIRHNLRDRVVKSPLMDQHAFARNIEHAYREMWKRWCDEQK
jgi:protein O-GlcNAc transferase